MQKNFLLFNSLRDKRPGREPLAYICDFSRYEKSSSMKRPTLKVIDFDSVVQNTKSSKSILLIRAFSHSHILAAPVHLRNNKLALFSVFDSTNQAHILIKGKLTYLLIDLK